MDRKTLYLIAGGGVAAALLFVYAKGAKSTGQALGGAVADLATGLVRGVTEPFAAAIGSGMDFISDNSAGSAFQTGASWLGVPRTNMTECERAKAEGRTWDASFVCPAGDFIKYLYQ
nr:hypothetical protein [uncultured Comamonas sp.]